MSWSMRNQMWGRMVSQRHDDRIQREIEIAASLQRRNPGMTRDEALKQAAAIVEGGNAG